VERQHRQRMLMLMERQRRRQEVQRRQEEQLPHYFVHLRSCHPAEGPKSRRWQSLVEYDPHLHPPSHGYFLLQDSLGQQRLIKAENLLPSTKPRHCPRKLRFASTVGVKTIPRFDDPINADAWNNDYHRNVEINRQWEQQEWRLEAQGKKIHRRLVVSSIAMKDFRRTVVDALVDHGQTLRMRWVFRRNVVPALVDHSHRLRWQWALQHHREGVVRSTFQKSVLAELDQHCFMMRRKWNLHLHRKTFQPNVVAALVDHSHRLRWKWALHRRQGKAQFHEAILGSLAGHCSKLRLKWSFKAAFHRTVVPALVEHCCHLRCQWALQHVLDAPDDEVFDDDVFDDDGNEDDDGIGETAPSRTEIDDHGHDDDDDDDDDDGDDDDDDGNDGDDGDDDDVGDGIECSVPTRQPRHRRAGTSPDTNMGGATLWLDGLRRSARLQPPLGSVYQHGHRRSARFL
jgi:hypothetical protein